MYNLIKNHDLDYSVENDYEEINEFDIGNDFSNSTFTNNTISDILNYGLLFLKIA